MKIYDCHIHILDGDEKKEAFLEKMYKAGICGGILFSLSPASFSIMTGPKEASARLENLFCWCDCDKNLFPFFWIDPLEDDALEQVSKAVKMGVRGFKVICDRYYPGDEKAMSVFRSIAASGLPILFHSGILWDGKPSSMYNRPVYFESLLEVEKLKFAMAHIAWPWCDEMLAVYGKFQSSFKRRPDLSCELFIDISRGTPAIYREEALSKVFKIGYPLGNNVFFGSDRTVKNYQTEDVRKVIDDDLEIYRRLDLTEETIERIFSKNLLRFLEKSENSNRKGLK